MSKQGVNPFLPNYEYIPDAEPRIFDDCVYIYGSHDAFDGKSFCINDYICYSAKVNDLTNWRYEGVIYRRMQDPKAKKGVLSALFAPDVIKGLDDKYYMYYTVGFSGKISVAVCDSPAGSFQFLGYVKYPNGKLLGSNKDHFQFDPGLFIDDDHKIYLYSGFAPKCFPLLNLMGKKIAKQGAMVMELEPDMLTIKTPYQYIAKTIFNSKGTSFAGHEFFEASSMRKINGYYYFIYSSISGHELCYAVSDKPDRDFKYGGTLVSIADLGISNKSLNHTGNTHGSLLSIGDKHYIFYHRQTNRNSFSRQACAEEITLVDQHFKQAEITSHGLNAKPLAGVGKYDATIACNLYTKKGTHFYGATKHRKGHHAYFTQHGIDRLDNPNQYIANFNKKTIAAYKYFDFDNPSTIAVDIKGKATGKIIVSLQEDTDTVAEILISKTKETTRFTAKLATIKGKQALYFKFVGKGNFDFTAFELLK